MNVLTGKRWSNLERKKLEEQVAAGKSFGVIAALLGRSEEAVRAQAARMGLDNNKQTKNQCSLLSGDLILPEDLPSVETVLKTAAAAMAGLETPGLSKTEVMRLRALIQSAAVYQVRIAEYIDYRRIEAKLIDLDEKYERLVRERRKNTKT